MTKIMRKMIQTILLLTVFFTVMPPRAADADVTTPENIRIGLYFKYESNNINTAVSSFKIFAEKGLNLGNCLKNKFTSLYEVKNADTLIIRKDAYFIKNSGSLSEYDTSASSIPNGEKIGPFHVQIGGNYKDLKTLSKELKEIKENGIFAYPVYADTWQIWAGFYIDKSEAQKDIDKNIKKKLGSNDYKVIMPDEDRIAVETEDGEVLLLYASGKGVFQIYPMKENNPYIFNIDGKKYRGGIEVRRFSFSDMTVINLVQFEQYLYGVVPREIEASSHPEALKAQAVAARTYTLNNLNKYNSFCFDMCTTVYSQVYGGYGDENPATNKAVDDTKGKKITYKGALAQAYYFSSSGGRTEDSKNVWGYEYPYLRSVEDKYESGKSWNYNWETVFSDTDIRNIMRNKSYDLGTITSVTISKTSSAGRATELIIKGTKGEQIFTNSRCRSALPSLESQWYEITTDSDISINGVKNKPESITLAGKSVITADGLKKVNETKGETKILGAGEKSKFIPTIPTQYVFAGKGWGHAIGMSQEGAKGMALEGFTYEEILTHYFQGTKVE